MCWTWFNGCYSAPGKPTWAFPGVCAVPAVERAACSPPPVRGIGARLVPHLPAWGRSERSGSPCGPTDTSRVHFGNAIIYSGFCFIKNIISYCYTALLRFRFFHCTTFSVLFLNTTRNRRQTKLCECLHLKNQNISSNGQPKGAHFILAYHRKSVPKCIVKNVAKKNENDYKNTVKSSNVVIVFAPNNFFLHNLWRLPHVFFMRAGV